MEKEKVRAFIKAHERDIRDYAYYLFGYVIGCMIMRKVTMMQFDEGFRTAFKHAPELEPLLYEAIKKAKDAKKG